MTPIGKTRDFDADACHEAGRSHGVVCEICNRRFSDGQLDHGATRIICPRCIAPNHTITGDDWKRSIAANRAAPNLVLQRAHQAISRRIGLGAVPPRGQ